MWSRKEVPIGDFQKLWNKILQMPEARAAEDPEQQQKWHWTNEEGMDVLSELLYIIAEEQLSKRTPKEQPLSSMAKLSESIPKAEQPLSPMAKLSKSIPKEQLNTGQDAVNADAAVEAKQTRTGQDAVNADATVEAKRTQAMEQSTPAAQAASVVQCTAQKFTPTKDEDAQAKRKHSENTLNKADEVATAAAKLPVFVNTRFLFELNKPQFPVLVCGTKPPKERDRYCLQSKMRLSCKHQEVLLL
jgi:hypothetical protein